MRGSRFFNSMCTVTLDHWHGNRGIGLLLRLLFDACWGGLCKYGFVSHQKRDLFSRRALQNNSRCPLNLLLSSYKVQQGISIGSETDISALKCRSTEQVPMPCTTSCRYQGNHDTGDGTLDGISYRSPPLPKRADNFLRSNSLRPAESPPATSHIKRQANRAPK
jgi:hypothetical protein